MSKTKYKYNPNTLSYDEVDNSWRSKLKKISYHLISGLVFSVIIIMLSYSSIKKKGKNEGARELEVTKLEL